MTRFEGDKIFPLAPAELWLKLTDARFLVQCLPNVESMTNVDADQASMVVRPNFLFVRGKLDAHLLVAEKMPPQSAKLILASKGIGSSSRVDVALDLQPHETGTRLHWVAEIKELGGLLKMVPSGLIQGAANSLFVEVLGRVESQLGSA